MKNIEQFYEMVNNSDACREFTESKFADVSFPDAAFIVEKGAEKNPRTGNSQSKFRHLPHHNKNVKSPTENSSVNIPQLRNALARVNQVKPVKENRAAYIARARRHLQRHARVLLKNSSGHIREEARKLCREFDIPCRANNPMIVKIMYDTASEDMVLILNDTMQPFKDLDLYSYTTSEGVVETRFYYQSDGVDQNNMQMRQTVMTKNSVGQTPDVGHGKEKTYANDILDTGAKVSITYDVQNQNLTLAIDGQEQQFTEINLYRYVNQEGPQTSFYYTDRQDFSGDMIIETRHMTKNSISTPVPDVPGDELTTQRFKDLGIEDRGGPSLKGEQPVIVDPQQPVVPEDKQLQNPNFEQI